jgi:hypothetical protein
VFFWFFMALLSENNIHLQGKTIHFPSNQNNIIQFSNPSKEIGCTYIPFNGAGGIDTGQNSSELHCYYLNSPNKAVSLGVAGKARRLSVTKKLKCCNENNILPYKMRWSEGGYSCRSKPNHFNCTWGKHGFTMTSKRIIRF